MKNRILLSIGLICSFMGMNIQEGMGQCTICSGSQNIQIGLGSATGAYSYAFGNATSLGDYGWSIGSKVFANGDNSFVIGYSAIADASKSFNYIFGCGTPDDELINNVDNSIMFGINSNLSTLLVSGASGYNTWGNVGIGNITAPASLLHVRDQIRVGLTSGANGSLVFNNSASNTITFNTPASMSSQSYTLPTAGTTTSGSVLANDGTGQLLWAAPGTVSNAWLLTGNTIASTDWLGTINGLDLVVKTTNLERMRVMAAGNVGIGTTTPDGILHLNATNTYMIVEKGTANEGGMVWHNGPQSAGTANASLMFETDETLRLRNAVSNQHVVINVNDGGTDTEALFIEGNSAHVGIGTSNPLMRLHVVALAAIETPDDETIARFAVSDNDTAFIQLENIDDTNGHFAGGIRSISSTADNSALLIAAAVHSTLDTGTEPMMVFSPRRLGSTSITTRPLFEWANNTNSKMLMKANGDLGIGTTTPSGKLHVVGTAFVNTLPAADETPVGWIATGTNQFQLVDNSGSSIHFKENVDELEFDHEAFLSLQPKRYNWKPALGGKPSVGFIAQEAGEVFPELADIRPKHTINDDGTLDYDSLGQAIVDTTQLEPYGFKYHKLPVYTFAIVKQLHADNLENRQRIDVLEQQLAQCCANPQLRQEQTGQMEPAKRIVPTIESIALTSSPNPFSEYSDIKSTIPQSAKSASLIIVNAQGAVVQHSTLSSGQSEVIRIYTSEIGVGLFTCYLLLDGDIAASCKIISTK